MLRKTALQGRGARDPSANLHCSLVVAAVAIGVNFSIRRLREIAAYLGQRIPHCGQVKEEPCSLMKVTTKIRRVMAEALALLASVEKERERALGEMVYLDTSVYRRR